MSYHFWLNDAQMARLQPYLPKFYGKPRVDDWRVSSGIILRCFRPGMQARRAGTGHSLVNAPWYISGSSIERIVSHVPIQHGTHRRLRR